MDARANPFQPSFDQIKVNVLSLAIQCFGIQQKQLFTDTEVNLLTIIHWFANQNGRARESFPAEF